MILHLCTLYLHRYNQCWGPLHPLHYKFANLFFANCEEYTKSVVAVGKLPLQKYYNSFCEKPSDNYVKVYNLALFIVYIVHLFRDRRGLLQFLFYRIRIKRICPNPSVHLEPLFGDEEHHLIP